MKNNKKKHTEEFSSDDCFAAFDLQTEFVYIVDPKTFEIVFINKAIRDFYSGTKPLGNFCYNVYMNRDIPCQDCPVVRYSKLGERRFSQMIRPDGISILAGASPIKWKNKEYMLVTCTDITSYRDEIEEERNQYRDAVLSDSICSYQIDLSDDTIYRTPSFAAEDYLDVMNLEFPMSYSEYLAELTPKRDIVFKKEGSEYLQTCKGLLEAFAKGEKHIEIDYRCTGKDSFRRKTILLSKRKTDNHVIANVIVHDVTDDVKTINQYQKIENKEQPLQNSVSLFPSVSCGILQYNKNSDKITFVNEEALEILGYTSVEELQKNFEHGLVKNIFEEDRDEIRSCIDGINEEVPEKTCEYRIKHKEEKVVYCFSSIQFLKDAAGTDSVTYCLFDISERKQMDEVIKSYKLTKSFLNAYHQVCTFDLLKDKYSILKSFDLSPSFVIREGENINVFIQNWINFLPEESFEKATKFMDFSVINERFKDKDTDSIEYLGKNGNWFRGFLIVSSRNPKGNIESITFASQDITAEKIAAIESQQIFENQHNFFKSISDVYLSMYRCDFINNRLSKINKENVEEPKYEPFNVVWKSWCSNDFTAESYNSSRSFLEFKTLQKRLTEHGTLSDDVLTIKNGWLNVLIVPYIKNEAGLVTAALVLFRCIDDIKRCELRHAESLVQAYRITKSLTNAYHSCFSFDLKNQTFMTLKDSEDLDLKNKSFDIKLAISRWTASLSEESCNIMRRFLDFSTINDRLKDKDFICTEFVSEAGVQLKATLVASERSEDNRLSCITFFTENLDEHRKKEREYLNTLEKSYQVTKSLSDVYLRCYNFNLETNEYSVLNNSERIMKHYAKQQFDEAFEEWSNSFSEENKKLIRDWLNLETLDVRMKDKDVLSLECKNLYENWFRGYLIVAARSETKKIKSVTLCLQNIDDEKKTQFEKETAIRERMFFLSSIERIFYSMYLMDFETNSLFLMSSGTQGNFPVRPLRQFWNTWCDEDFGDAMLHEHQQFLNIETLPDRLKHQGVLSDDILSKANGWQNFLIVPYKHDENGNVIQALLLIRIIDELKKAELKQQEELRIANRAAEHDELTGIYNRYGFNKRLDELYRRPVEKQVAVIMMDLDSFKHVNDYYGHDAGDLVLKKLADNLVEMLGKNSLYCRWGGEEFNIFIYSDLDPNVIAELIRKKMEESIVVFEGKEIKVTLSIGVCIARDMTKTKIAKLINTADKCMYTSKRTGKNRVTVETV